MSGCWQRNTASTSTTRMLCARTLPDGARFPHTNHPHCIHYHTTHSTWRRDKAITIQHGWLPCAIYKRLWPCFSCFQMSCSSSPHTFMCRAPNECVLFHWPPSEITIVPETPSKYVVKMVHKYSTFYYFSPPKEVLKNIRSTSSWACKCNW